MKNAMLVLILVSFMAVEGQAQKEKVVKVEVNGDKPGKKTIRIEKNVDGKLEVIEREVDIKAPKARVYTFNSSGDLEIDTLKKGERVLMYGDGFSWEDDFPRLSDRNRRNLNTLKFNMEDLSDKLSRDFSNFRGSINFSEGISQVQVFTNKPATHILNLRFKSSVEEPVSISVVDMEGERVFKESVDDFKGEYMGQLHLKEGTKGTFFVIISQGENGISRKVKVE